MTHRSARLIRSLGGVARFFSSRGGGRTASVERLGDPVLQTARSATGSHTRARTRIGCKNKSAHECIDFHSERTTLFLQGTHPEPMGRLRIAAPLNPLIVSFSGGATLASMLNVKKARGTQAWGMSEIDRVANPHGGEGESSHQSHPLSLPLPRMLPSPSPL
jgi:hypothetical protein